MNKPDTRYLDIAINILGGGRTKRKPSGRVIHLVDLGPTIGISVQVNKKEVLLVSGEHALERARLDAVRRADTMERLMGKRPTIIEE